MKAILKISCLLLAGLYPLQLLAQNNANVIPQPVEMQLSAGHFIIDGGIRIKYNRSDKELRKVVSFFSDYVKRISGYELPEKGKSSKTITFKISPVASVGDEGYKLKVQPTSILVEANTTAGIFYGMQTLLQTLPQVRTNALLKIPSMQVTDYPRFKWRGMHLDVSRHFFPPEAIKNYIDLLSAYKLNTFHWHLVDDQGWRIEIKKYPELTDVGAWRVNQNDKIWSSRPQAKGEEEPTYGGFYTQDQIKDIIKYAAVRNVTIVPEIEMPGHVASAIAAYPHLSCSQKPQLSMTGGNYNGMSSNYCAGNEEVFSFLEDVLDEVVALFPSRYIHIGGDEVDKNPWKKCPKCQARIQAEGLKDENELQSYFIKRMEKYLITKNRKMIGWDEILEGGLAPEATVMSWRGEAGGIEAAKMGHDVVMTPGSPLYFDHYQAGPEGEPIAIGGFNTLRKVYEYDPIPKELSAEQAKHVLGAQANVWTEYITTTEHLEYMVLPRMLGVAEIVWTPKESKNWLDFSRRLKYHFEGFELKGLRYSPGNFTVDIKPNVSAGKVSVTLSTEALNGDIYYTTNGDIPNLGSIKYTAPISIDSALTLKAVTAVNGKVMGLNPAQQSFAMHKATGKAVSYVNPVSGHYQANGQNSLTDGVRGTYAVGKFWHGFSGRDLIATIDLGEEKEISNMALGCLQNYSDWIFMPSWVKFEVSSDGKNFTEVGKVNNPISLNEKNGTIYNFKSEFKTVKAKFVRVTGKVLDALPKGHSGEGKPAWLFADEIVVN